MALTVDEVYPHQTGATGNWNLRTDVGANDSFIELAWVGAEDMDLSGYTLEFPAEKET